jgi:hypothetical protein
MQLNGVSLVDRHNRAGVLEKVALRVFFVNNGVYFDPYDISGVTVFNKLSNTSPSSVIDINTNLISSSVASSLILMHFGASANDSGAALNPSSYAPATNAASTSGVYRVGTGEYIVVLDGSLDISGRYNFYGSSLVVANAASSVADYIDVWTVKYFQNSDYQAVINDFHLYRDTIFAVTQPLLLTTTNRLVNKNIKLDSKVDLKVTTDVNIENRDIDDATKNVFRDSAVVSAMFKIEKINEDTMALPSRVEVSGFSQTSSLVDITSDNTMVFSFNTAALATHPSVANFAGLTGTYCLTCKYSLLNQTIVTQPMYFIIS